MRSQDPYCDWVRVTFRVFSESLDPDEITNTTGIVPTSAWKVGERRPFKKPAPLSKQGHWHVMSHRTAKSTNIDDHVEEILQRLEGHADYFAALAEQHRVDLFIGWSGDTNRGGHPSVSPELARSIEAFGAKIDFDIYD